MAQAAKRLETPTYMTSAEAATYLRVSLNFLRYQAHIGRIPAINVGSERRPGRGKPRPTWRFRKEDLDAWMASKATVPAQH